ncbi:MAG: hypothetical protein AAGD11_11420 [Planctomycetota bacterium]
MRFKILSVWCVVAGHMLAANCCLGQYSEITAVQPAYAGLVSLPEPAGQPATGPATEPAGVGPVIPPDQGEYAALIQRLAALEAMVATQPSKVQPAAYQAIPATPPVDCGAFCDDSLAVSTWYAGIDLTVLQPSYSSAVFGIYDEETGVGPRLHLGRENFRGFGWRTRFWWLDVDSDALIDDTPPIPFTLNLQASRFDVDFYRRFVTRSGSFLFGSGITGAGLRFKFDDVLAVTEEGGGVSVFAEGAHRFYESKNVTWALLSRGRWSYLIGEWEDASTTSFPSGDTNMKIAEAELAVQYTRKFGDRHFFGTYGIEAQVWDSTYFWESTGFLGSTIRLGMTW